MPFVKGQRPWNAGTRTQVACAQCGTLLERTPYEIARSRRQFCGVSCRQAAYRASAVGAGNPRYGKRAGVDGRCEACGRAFYLHPSTAARRAGRFCSMACYSTQKSNILRGIPKPASMRAKLSAARKGVPRPEVRKPPVVVTCLTCGLTTEYVGKKRTHAHVRRFCTTDCWYAYLRTHPEAHSWFKGGYEPYYGPNWKHQAKLARERDGHTCRRCGVHQVNPRLDVHHLQSRRSFGRDDFIAMNALGNLVTLCKSCHRKTESGLVSI